MDLRTLPPDLSPDERCDERRRRIEDETGVDLRHMKTEGGRIGHADERNCEQMFGTIPLPVGLAGPLTLTFSSGEKTAVHLPLATTEAALVASVNRGCKAVSEVKGEVRTKSVQHGTSRSIVLKPKTGKGRSYTMEITEWHPKWKRIGEATSSHLNITRFDVEEADGYLFLTIFCDTGEAMGMNMVTIAAQEIGNWLSNELPAELITVAGNVDSDKKPSKRTHDRGRGIEVGAEAILPSSVIEKVLKTTPEKLLSVADAKLRVGSALSGALGANLHAANIIAALYLATGQDAAHVVEGSLADTEVTRADDGIRLSIRLPALLVGVRGGGTTLPAQAQCLSLLLKPETTLPPKIQLAETIGAAVLAGELSLLAAQAEQRLASSHKKLAR